MMRRAHVALTPGRDFGPAQAERFVRLSFASGHAAAAAAVHAWRVNSLTPLTSEIAVTRR
jgi:aspartate/methionine/tyrosine aminotransferase